MTRAAGAGEVGLAPGAAVHVGGIDPHPPGLQFLDKAGQVLHPGHRQVLPPPRAEALPTAQVSPTLRRLGITTPWAPAHSAVRITAPRLWGVFQLVAHQQEGGLPSLFRQGEDVLHAGVLLHRRQGHHPLVVGAGAQVVQLSGVHLFDGDPLVFGLLQQGQQPAALLSPLDVQTVHRAAGFQGFVYRVAPCDHIPAPGSRSAPGGPGLVFSCSPLCGSPLSVGICLVPHEAIVLSILPQFPGNLK